MGAEPINPSAGVITPAVPSAQVQEGCKLFKQVLRIFGGADHEDYYDDRTGLWDMECLAIDLELLQFHTMMSGRPEPPPLEELPDFVLPEIPTEKAPSALDAWSGKGKDGKGKGKDAKGKLRGTKRTLAKANGENGERVLKRRVVPKSGMKGGLPPLPPPAAKGAKLKGDGSWKGCQKGEWPGKAAAASSKWAGKGMHVPPISGSLKGGKGLGKGYQLTGKGMSKSPPGGVQSKARGPVGTQTKAGGLGFQTKAGGPLGVHSKASAMAAPNGVFSKARPPVKMGRFARRARFGCRASKEVTEQILDADFLD